MTKVFCPIASNSYHGIGAAGDDKELGAGSGVRPPEYRCGDIRLSGIAVRHGETV